MNEDTHQKLMNIKRSFRLMMNGPVSQSMRSKGVDYKLNWGVPLPQLRQMATEYDKDMDLAIALWKEDIRECKILATLLMPVDEMSPELVDLWMEELRSEEMAEMLSFHLLQYLAFAPSLAFQLMASNNDLYQITAYHLLSRLFLQGKEPNERGINEFLDQVMVALQSKNRSLRHAAANCVLRFANLGASYEEVAKVALKGLVDIF